MIEDMPIISMFYGIIIEMYFDDHNPPHFHARYNGEEAMFDFDGKIINGKLPKPQIKLIQAWCAIHHDELYANWVIANEKGKMYKISPLK